LHLDLKPGKTMRLQNMRLQNMLLQNMLLQNMLLQNMLSQNMPGKNMLLKAHETAKKGADLAVLHSNVHTEEAIRGDVLIGVHHAQAPQHLRHLLMQLADAPCLTH